MRKFTLLAVTVFVSCTAGAFGQDSTDLDVDYALKEIFDNDDSVSKIAKMLSDEPSGLPDIIPLRDLRGAWKLRAGKRGGDLWKFRSGKRAPGSAVWKLRSGKRSDEEFDSEAKIDSPMPVEIKRGDMWKFRSGKRSDEEFDSESEIDSPMPVEIKRSDLWKFRSGKRGPSSYVWKLRSGKRSLGNQIKRESLWKLRTGKRGSFWKLRSGKRSI